MNNDNDFSSENYLLFSQCLFVLTHERRDSTKRSTAVLIIIFYFSAKFDLHTYIGQSGQKIRGAETLWLYRWWPVATLSIVSARPQDYTICTLHNKLKLSFSCPILPRLSFTLSLSRLSFKFFQRLCNYLITVLRWATFVLAAFI